MKKLENKSRNTSEDKPKSIFRVLVIDDDIDFNAAICNRLKTIGVQVDTCFTGKDASTRVHDKYYDLVILDILLNDTDGVQVFKKIKKLRPCLHIVLISAYIQEDIVLEAKKLPAISFIEKPFGFIKLKKIINQYKRGKGNE